MRDWVKQRRSRDIPVERQYWQPKPTESNKRLLWINRPFAIPRTVKRLPLEPQLPKRNSGKRNFHISTAQDSVFCLAE